ncbi:MAG: immune inhibitor A, partial [Methylococcales bacterium]|nr:immune inhibitor A [Methylococcales bacterium]
PVMTFSAYVDIEEDWDYAYVQASADGVTWDVLLNDEGFYGTVDLNGTSTWMGIGGLTGAYDGTLTYDLSSYAGDSSVWVRFLYATDAAVQNPGMWLDDLAIDDGASSIYSTDFEDNSDWTNAGWEVVPYDEFTPHYYLVEWRNDTGSIASEGHTQQYYSLAHDGTGWNVDKFSANVPGMLIWYRNTMYNNNQAVNGGREFASPATGPKGELLLVDANYDPVTWSGGFWISGTNGSTVFTTDATFSNRRGAMDGAYSLEDSVAWWLHDYHDSDNDVMDFGSKDAVTGFHDSTGSVPGWVWSGDGFVYRADMASSVVIPAWADYTTKIRGLGEPFDVDTDLVGMEIGDDFTAFWGFTVGGQELGSGNPGDTDVQYGLHIEIVEEAADGTWGKIKVWNAHNDIYASGGEGMAMLGGIDGNARYHFTNVGSPLDA